MSGALGKKQALRLIKRMMGTPSGIRCVNRDGMCIVEARLTHVLSVGRHGSEKREIREWLTLGRASTWAKAFEQARHGQAIA